MWGEREEGLKVVALQTGETPKALRDKPELYPWLRWIYEAFWMLDGGRLVKTMTVRPIPMGEMAAYMSVFEVEDKPLFVRRIRALDWVYVQHINAEIKRRMEVEKIGKGRTRG